MSTLFSYSSKKLNPNGPAHLLSAKLKEDRQKLEEKYYDDLWAAQKTCDHKETYHKYIGNGGPLIKCLDCDFYLGGKDV